MSVCPGWLGVCTKITFRVVYLQDWFKGDWFIDQLIPCILLWKTLEAWFQKTLKSVFRRWRYSNSTIPVVKPRKRVRSWAQVCGVWGPLPSLFPVSPLFSFSSSCKNLTAMLGHWHRQSRMSGTWKSQLHFPWEPKVTSNLEIGSFCSRSVTEKSDNGICELSHWLAFEIRGWIRKLLRVVEIYRTITSLNGY